MPDSPLHPADLPPLHASGKWLRAGKEKWFLRGVSYGPFRPRGDGLPFPTAERLAADFQQIQRLGFNTVRLYDLPTEEIIQCAMDHGLRLLLGIPWTDHVDFLRCAPLQDQIRQAVETAARQFKDTPSVIGFLVGNEIEKTLARWMGPAQVRAFLESLIETGREVAPAKLFSYATYPSTEYLVPANADFLAINLYLEQPEALAAYLQRLQNLAGDKPLIITEFGLDVATHGESLQAETRRWFHRLCARMAVAGTVWFSYTDEWFRGGRDITDWRFGLVDANRHERPACHALIPEELPQATPPQISFSVIVCTWNGSATLAACLKSLRDLRYGSYEVLLIDDGSTENIAAIAQQFPEVRYVRQEHAGLSVARNLGASLATGEILAYTDDDCLVDEDWLCYLAAAFDSPQWVAAGGPNIPPKPRNRTEAIVAAAPGAPAHVLLSDIEAEHLPGCNLAIRKEALASIGGFRAQYAAAGDDVDVCWRLQEAGGKLRFVPGAMVWHHRRYSLKGYFRQQAGYGTAEALLIKDHPGRFGALGGARWQGGIYGDRATGPPLDEGNIFHGPQGEGLFQGIYLQGIRCWVDWIGGVLWVAIFLATLLARQPLAAGGVLVFSLLLAAYRKRLLTHPPFALSVRESLLLLGLCWYQPVLREWKRLLGILRLGARPAGKHALPPPKPCAPKPRKFSLPLAELSFWNDAGKGRSEWLTALRDQLQKEGVMNRQDDGWRLFDIELKPQSSISIAFLTMTEYHGGQRMLTRIRLLMRVQWRLLGWLVLLPACTAFIPFMKELSLTVIVITVGMFVGTALLMRLRWQKRMIALARQVSLEPMA